MEKPLPAGVSGARPPEARYRDGSYLERNPGWHAEDAPAKARWIRRLLERNGLDPGSVGEAGCGAGGVLLALAREAPETVRFVGYEISPVALELCPRRALPNLSYRLGDLTAEESVHHDLLLVLDVIEHVEDYLGFLRGLRPRARHHVFHIPLDLSVQSLLRRSRLLRERDQVGHLHYFTRETALATLSDAGYRVLDQTYTAGCLELPARSALSRLARIPRRLLAAVDPGLAARLLGGFSLLVLAEPAGATGGAGTPRRG